MSTAIKEERNIKKRKLENFLPQEIIYEIILFIDDFKDFISFSQLNKYFYNTLLINENNILNLMLKKIKIKLNNKLPNYLFKINYLRAKKFGENNLLNNFKNLKYLEVSGIYKINNFIFPELDNLKELKLFNCDLSFNSLQYLKNLQKLEIINSCDGDDKINLENLINLIKLKMVNSNILENSLQKLINLEKLKLINSTEEVLQYNVDFSNLMKLKYLHICGMIIDSNNFNKLPNLEEFTCNLQEIDNLNNLKQIKRLKIINLENKKINNRRLIDKDLIDLPNIVKLNLQFNKDITGECLLKLINLEKLNIGFTNIKDEYLINLQKLKYLNVSYCNFFTGECLLKLMNLEELKIYHRKNTIKDEYLIHLKKLKYLHIYRCGICGECFKYLPSLREILVDESEIKEEYLQELKNRRPFVKIF